MKRRMLGMFLCVAMVISALIGCNSNADKGGTASSGSVQKSKGSESNANNGEETGGKEIYMFISQPEYAEAINTLIDEYKKVEPDVTVRYETTQNDYPTLLKAKLNSGECPDIFSSTSGKEIEVYK